MQLKAERSRLVSGSVTQPLPFPLSPPPPLSPGSNCQGHHQSNLPDSSSSENPAQPQFYFVHTISEVFVCSRVVCSPGWSRTSIATEDDLKLIIL